MRVLERNVQEISGSLLITLPKDWADSLKVRKGAKLKLVVSENGALSIYPEFVEKVEKKHVSMDYDKHFVRRFFREYFGGNEKITVLFQSPSQNRDEVYYFLKNFANVQIIEDEKDKIVVKCFKINELSIEECLNRMFKLSISMLDEAATTNDKRRLIELDQMIAKFYYLAVAQIRRFLEEGKFTQEKQISLLRAMDYRMVAQKVERIGDFAKSMPDDVGEEVLPLLQDLKDYYSKSFGLFIENDFENALLLWSGARKRLQELSEMEKVAVKRRNFNYFLAIQNLKGILAHAKEISMLVR